MRFIALLALVLLAAGCGGSAAPRPTPTARPFGITDPASKVNTGVLRVRKHRTYVLLYVTMHNGSRHAFTSPTATPFIDDALVEPNSQGKVGVCSADNSIGPGLEYASLPAGATHTGWLRCDFPATTHVVAIFWLNHDLANYRV